MQSTNEPNKNFRYGRVILLIFFVRTVVLGIALFKGPYFTIEESQHFKTLSVFLDITNIFQLMFMFNVIESKNIFQFVLYIPLLLYSLSITTIIIISSYQRIIPKERKHGNFYIAIAFLYAYGGILISEVIIHVFMYNRLRNDFMWSNFKKVGVNPVINEAFKRREQLNAVKRFSITFLCGEIVNFSINFGNLRHLHYILVLASLIIVFLVVSIFPDQEHRWQRTAFLVFVGVCIAGGIAYSATIIVLYFLDSRVKEALVLDSIFYVFNMAILFIGAFRDYLMFGSGLKEYYTNRVEIEKRRRRLLFSQ